jgi:hypothetical protein
MDSPRADAGPSARRVPSLRLETAGLLALLAGIFTATLVPRLNTDLWWHLKTGQIIASTGAIPAHDTLSFTAAGEPWLNHEWLAELLFFHVHRRLGVAGLLALLAAVVTATFWLLFRRMIRREVPAVVALLFLGPAYAASVGSISLRIQPFSLLLLSVYLLLIERFRSGRRRGELLWFPVLMLPWSNLHGGFAAGVAVMAIEVAGQWLEIRRGSSAVSRRDRRALSLALAATVAATFVNPNGLAQVLYPLRFLSPNPFTRVINESQPSWPPRDAVTWAFFLLLVVLVVSAARARKRVPWPDLLAVLSFTALALSQLRHVSLWAIAITPVAADLASRAVRKRSPRFASEVRSGPSPRASALHLAVLIAAVGSFAAIASTYLTRQNLQRLEARDYPAAATAFLRDHPASPRLFTEYRWAGYALWKLHPRYRTFIDGRADTVFSPAILEDYRVIHRVGQDWAQRLDRHGVDTILVRSDGALSAALRGRREWTMLHRDPLATVFVRNGGVDVSR